MMTTRTAIELAIDALVECGQCHNAHAKRYLDAIARLRQVNAQRGCAEAGLDVDQLPEAIDIMIDG